MTYDGLIEVCGTEAVNNMRKHLPLDTGIFFFNKANILKYMNIYIHVHVDIYAIRLYSGSLQRSIYLHQPNNNY